MELKNIKRVKLEVQKYRKHLISTQPTEYPISLFYFYQNNKMYAPLQYLWCGERAITNEYSDLLQELSSLDQFGRKAILEHKKRELDIIAAENHVHTKYENLDQIVGEHLDTHKLDNFWNESFTDPKPSVSNFIGEILEETYKPEQYIDTLRFGPDPNRKAMDLFSDDRNWNEFNRFCRLYFKEFIYEAIQYILVNIKKDYLNIIDDLLKGLDNKILVPSDARAKLKKHEVAITIYCFLRSLNLCPPEELKTKLLDSLKWIDYKLSPVTYMDTTPVIETISDMFPRIKQEETIIIKFSKELKKFHTHKYKNCLSSIHLKTSGKGAYFNLYHNREINKEKVRSYLLQVHTLPDDLITEPIKKEINFFTSDPISYI